MKARLWPQENEREEEGFESLAEAKNPLLPFCRFHMIAMSPARMRNKEMLLPTTVSPPQFDFGGEEYAHW